MAIRGIALLLVLLAGAAGAPLEAQRPADTGRLLERQPYEFPFATQVAWLEFMGRAPVALDLAQLGEAYPAAEFEALARGEGAVAERIAFLSDGLRIRGVLTRPTAPGPHPAVIYNRGGNREFGRLVFLDVLRMLSLAGQGYVVVAAEYRGEGGSEGEPVLGSGDVDDVLALLPLVDSLPDVDRERIGMIGWSRGGLVTLHALARSDRFRAAITVAGDADPLDTARRRPSMDSAVFAASVPGYAADREGALRAVSAMGVLDRIPASTALLVLHGSADDRVHPEVSLRLSSALLAAGMHHRLLLLEGGSHSLLDHAATVRREMEHWLDRHLR